MKLIPILALGIVAFASSPAMRADPVCTGPVTDGPARMYDFKLGDWTIAWRNQGQNGAVFEFSAVSHVYTIMGSDISIDEQTADYFKGITFRTYDPQKQEWVVRWLPAGSTFEPVISARLEDCVPVERHKQLTPAGELADVRTSFTNITPNSFEFHQDWSLDGGETWSEDVLFYRAIRVEPEIDDSSLAPVL